MCALKLPSDIGSLSKIVLGDQDDAVESTWRRIKETLNEGVDECCPKIKPVKHKWISQRTLSLVQERRQALDRQDKPSRNRIGRQIKKSLGHDKDEWLTNQCEVLEAASNRGDSKRVFAIVRDLTGQRQSSSSAAKIKDKNGAAIKTKDGRNILPLS